MDPRPSFVYLQPLFPEIVVGNATLIQHITVAILGVFAVGIYIRLTAYLSSFLVCYLGVIRFTLDTGWSTQMFFAAAILLMLYALYAEQDEFSVDGLRRRSTNGIAALNLHLKTSGTKVYKSTPLTVFLLGIGAIYLGSGIGKLAEGVGLDWISATNLGRRVVEGGYMYSYFGFQLESEIILFLAALGTIILETSFLLIIFFNKGRLFSLAIVGLLSFHIGIALFMGPVFVYTMVFLLLFVDWEGVQARLMSGSKLDLVYDERCYFCTQSLYFFKYLDVNEVVNFYSQSDIPEKYNNSLEYDFDQSMYAFTDNQAFEGYYAFRELCRHLGFLYPLYLFMRIPLMTVIGCHVYRYIAANRSRHFKCNLDA